MFTQILIGPLPVNVLDILLMLVAAVICIPLGWLYGKSLAAKGLNFDTAFQQGARQWGVLAVFLGVCALIAGVHQFPHQLNPAWQAFLEPVSWLLAKSGALFLAGMAYPLGKNGKGHDVWMVYSLALISTLGIQAIQTYLLRPLPASQMFVRISRDGSILQSSNVSCSAAALANGLRLFGIDSSEKEVARILGTRISGTSQYQLLQGIQRYGLYGYFVSVLPEHLAQIQRPAIVSIDLQVIAHSILVTGTDAKGNLKIIDPMSGTGKLSSAQFRKKLKDTRGIIITDKEIPHIDSHSPAFLIKDLQQHLNQAGLAVTASGIWDLATEQALRDFQSRWKLPVTGRIDELSYLLLYPIRRVNES